MFSREGNEACAFALNRIVTLINGDKFISQDELKAYVKTQVDGVAREYREVNDTEPEYHFEWRINKALEKRGYSFKISRYDF